MQRIGNKLLLQLVLVNDSCVRYPFLDQMIEVYAFPTTFFCGQQTGGLITFRAFMDWLRNDDDNDEDALEITSEQVPESVRRGLQEDGVAAGAAEEELLSAGNGDDEMNDRNADGLVGFTHLADQR